MDSEVDVAVSQLQEMDADTIALARFKYKEMKKQAKQREKFMSLDCLFSSFLILLTFGTALGALVMISTTYDMLQKTMSRQDEKEAGERIARIDRQRWISILFDKLDDSQLLSLLLSPLNDPETAKMIEDKVVSRLLLSAPITNADIASPAHVQVYKMRHNKEDV